MAVQHNTGLIRAEGVIQKGHYTKGALYTEGCMFLLSVMVCTGQHVCPALMLYWCCTGTQLRPVLVLYWLMYCRCTVGVL